MLPVGWASLLNHAYPPMGGRVFFFVVECLMTLLHCGHLARWYRWSWGCVMGELPRYDIYEWLGRGLRVPAMCFQELVEASRVSQGVA